MAANPPVREENRTGGAYANSSSYSGGEKDQYGRKNDNQKDVEATLEDPIAE